MKRSSDEPDTRPSKRAASISNSDADNIRSGSESDEDQSISSFEGFSSEREEDKEEEFEKEDSAELPSRTDVSEAQTFEELGIIPELCDATRKLNYHHPTPIQRASIPPALEGRDVIGLAETGSGKTAAYALPILQALMDSPQPLFALVLGPTRELVFQIAQNFEALGAIISVKVATLVGGMDMVPQAIALNKRPHILVATPGRLLDHLENTRGFSLRNLKYLVLDEADRLLDLDFRSILDKLLKNIPPNPPRKTYLFSATMTAQVESLQRASLKKPVRISLSSDDPSSNTNPSDLENKHQSHHSLPPSSLQQSYLFIPHVHKDLYLVYLLSLSSLAGFPTIVFVRTVATCGRVAILLRRLGLASLPLHGQLSQSSRLAALNKFRASAASGIGTLVATDVAARGLDLPSVDCVINYDLPGDGATYVHRVGRTARAGRGGKSISLVCQYDVELWMRIEHLLGRKLGLFDGGLDKEAVLALGERVSQAQRAAGKEMRDMEDRKQRRRNRGPGRSDRGIKQRGEDAEEE